MNVGEICQRDLLAFDAVNFSLAADDPPDINTLPDVWIWFSQQVVDKQVGGGVLTRNAREKALENMFTTLHHAKVNAMGTEWKHQPAWENLRSWIAEGEIRMVKVSRAEFNPRFRGWRVMDTGRAWTFIKHAVKALKFADTKPHERLSEFRARE